TCHRHPLPTRCDSARDGTKVSRSRPEIDTRARRVSPGVERRSELVARVVRAVAERLHCSPELGASRLAGLLEMPGLTREVPALRPERLRLRERRLRGRCPALLLEHGAEPEARRRTRVVGIRRREAGADLIE